MRRFAVAALLLSAALPAHADDTATAIKLRDAATKGSEAYAIVESLTTEVGQRLAATEAESRARQWAVAKLTALGFSNVRVEPFDMPAWERGAESLTVISPFPQKLTVAALGNSGSTPADGIEADVVRFATVDALKAAPDAAVKGKIVFLTHKMMRTQDGSSYGFNGVVRRSGPSIAASKGAAAVIIRSLGTDYHRNPHVGGTNWADGVAPIAAGALSLPDADQLDRILATGKPVRLKIVMTPRSLGTRQSGNVIGEIPGTSASDEVVLIGGHLDSWDLGTGAIDDGAGVAITTAAAKLILDAKLKPRRTIRVVMFGAEEPGLFGAQAYAVKHANDKHVLVAESDFGADRVWKLGSNVAPEALPLIKSMAAVLAPLGIAYDNKNDEGCGSDISVLTKLGIGCVEPAQDGTRYFDLHHTPDDTLDKIDRVQLDQNVAAYAVITWMAANNDVAFGPVKPH